MVIIDGKRIDRTRSNPWGGPPSEIIYCTENCRPVVTARTVDKGRVWFTDIIDVIHYVDGVRIARATITYEYATFLTVQDNLQEAFFNVNDHSK